MSNNVYQQSNEIKIKLKSLWDEVQNNLPEINFDSNYIDVKNDFKNLYEIFNLLILLFKRIMKILK